jgi:hypothetical protein
MNTTTIKRAMVRYVADPDMDADDPREGDDEVTILIYRGAWTEECDDNTGPIPTFLHVRDVYVGNGDRDDVALRAAQHWANVYGEGEHVAMKTLRGYSQGDWWDCVAVGPSREVVDDALGIFQMWLRRDVYVVARESGKVCNLGHTHWTTDDATGGIYAESKEEAIEYYRAEYDGGA